ncbi:MAG: XRE family transcriptional regulator [Bacteroidota bacterium]
MQKSIHIKANHDVLRWAREALALNKTRAAELLEISPNRLEQLELGLRQPTLDELKSMSKVYKRTIATLLLKSPPKEKPLPKDCRTIDSSKLGLFHEKTILAVRKARALTQTLLELKQELSVPTPEFKLKATLKDDPAQVGIHFRKFLNMDEIHSLETGNLFLEGCIEKIEEQGVAVFQLSLTPDGLRGFSLIDEVVPVIVVKRGGETPASKVFTLFHEFGHILLNEGGLCDINFNKQEIEIEKWCNAFAAELLVPTSLFLQQDLVVQYEKAGQKEWILKDLVELANRFHVGPLVTLRRLLTLNRTTPQFYNAKHEQWNKPSFGRSKNPEGRNIAKEAIRERGRRYISLVFKAYDSNRIDLKDMADYLGVKLSYIPKTRQLLTT